MTNSSNQLGHNSEHDYIYFDLFQILTNSN